MVVDFPEPVGPVTRIRPCSRAPHRVRSHSGAPSAFKLGTLVLIRRRIAPNPDSVAVPAAAVPEEAVPEEALPEVAVP